jgi:hypothetical protein
MVVDARPVEPINLERKTFVTWTVDVMFRFFLNLFPEIIPPVCLFRSHCDTIMFEKSTRGLAEKSRGLSVKRIAKLQSYMIRKTPPRFSFRPCK